MTAAIEPNNAQAIRAALEKLDAVEDAMYDIAMEDWTWRSVERHIEDIRKMLRSDLSKAESALLQHYTTR